MHDSLEDMYGVDVSAGTISTITDKVWPLVEAWQNRPLEAVYVSIDLAAIPVHLRREGRLENTAIDIFLAVDLQGRQDVLGHWVGDRAGGAKVCTNRLGQVQAADVKRIHH